MPLVEYVLLAILGSTPIAAGTPANAALRTYDAESVAQPSGAAPTEGSSSRADKSTSNSNKKATTDNKNGKKAEKSGKKGSSGTTTPPPK
jgi:hypothetical protein